MTTHVTTHHRWEHHLLDTMREQGDPAADAVVQALFAQGQVQAVNQLMKTLVRNDTPPPEALPPLVRAFFEREAALPDWADRHKIDHGVALFGRYGSQIMLILGHYSLPASYAARKGVQVLHMTARLSQAPRPRLLETAQLVIDVLSPGGLDRNGYGIRSAQKVRLMHAAVRYLILQRAWDSELGLPINQEDMAGTLMTFSYVIIDGLKKLGVVIPQYQAEAYIHTWNVIGHLMGVTHELMPSSLAEAEALTRIIEQRHFAPSPEGQAMARALVAMLQESARGTPFANMPASVMRHFLGDTTADILGLQKADWTRELIGPMQFLTRIASGAQQQLPFLALMAEVFGSMMIDGLLQMERGGRADFRIPTELRQSQTLARLSA